MKPTTAKSCSRQASTEWFGEDYRPDGYTDIIGRNFRQPSQGLGYDNSTVGHMWRAIIRPAKYT
jgi:hypothetical protein